MRPLIIGTGVAGTVAALALQKAGFEPEVFEAYDESSGLAHGLFLTVAVNGVDALRAVEADHVVRDAGFATNHARFFNGAGRQLGVVALGPILSDGTTTLTLRRDALYRGLLREVQERGIPVSHRKRLVNAEVLAGGGVRARFADGTSTDGDLLIGADGVHSVTRRLIDAANPDPRYAGLGNTGGFARVANVDVRPGEYVMIWGRRCFFGYTAAPDGEIWWFANPPSDRELTREELRATTSEQVRARLLEMLAHDRMPGAAIVSATQPPLPLFNQYDLPSVPTWHNGAMVIIGDAAHAVSPASGQGASLAAEDAVTLAQCLRDGDGIRGALDAWVKSRRTRVERIVRWGASMNATKKQGLSARLLRDLVLPFILRNADDPREIAKMAWMFRHHIEWEHSPVAGDVRALETSRADH